MASKSKVKQVPEGVDPVAFEFGQRGGKATFKKYGRDKMREWGLKGIAARRAKKKKKSA